MLKTKDVLFLLLLNGLLCAAKDDVHNVDDTENQLQLAGSRDCSSSAALPAVSSNVKVPPRKVSDGACLTLQGRGRGWQQHREGWVVLCGHLLGLLKASEPSRQ